MFLSGGFYASGFSVGSQVYNWMSIKPDPLARAKHDWMIISLSQIRAPFPCHMQYYCASIPQLHDFVTTQTYNGYVSFELFQDLQMNAPDEQ